MNERFQQQEYRGRINRAIDYIQSNLDKPLTLALVAESAHFSRYHFHRLFSAITGETLTSYIQRLKMERAAMRLLANPRASITAVALDAGYASPASFARLFKDHFGMSASQWRNGGFKEFRRRRNHQSKNDQTIGNNDIDNAGCSWYFDTMHCEAGAARDKMVSSNQSRRRTNMSITAGRPVEVRDREPMTVAYVRHIGPYKGDVQLFGNLWKRLMQWAEPRGLLNKPDVQCLSVYNDDPEMTDEGKLRVSVCITVPADTAVEGDVGKMEIPGGRYAIAHFEIGADQYQEAWNYVFGEWLPDSGYQPDDRPCFERCLNDPATHPERKHIIDICIPVKPL